jgi:hypothetical protein
MCNILFSGGKQKALIVLCHSCGKSHKNNLGVLCLERTGIFVLPHSLALVCTSVLVSSKRIQARWENIKELVKLIRKGI